MTAALEEAEVPIDSKRKRLETPLACLQTGQTLALDCMIVADSTVKGCVNKPARCAVIAGDPEVIV